MKKHLPNAQVKYHSNQNFSAKNAYPEALLDILGGEKFTSALKQIQNWPSKHRKNMVLPLAAKHLVIMSYWVPYVHLV